MKSARLALCLALLLLACSFARAQVADTHRAAAAALVELIANKDQNAAGFEALLPVIEAQSKQLGLAPELQSELRSIYRDWFTKHIDHAAIQSQVTELYVQAFTEAELQELLRFYQTPVGQKVLATLPELFQKGAALGLSEAQSKEHILRLKLNEFFKRALKAKEEASAEGHHDHTH